MILRCTRKLLTVLGSAVAEPAPAPDPEDWYANLLWFDRRKCLLLTHSATLFTIFEADVTASGLRVTRLLVTGLIGRELRREELPAGTFGDLGQQEVLFAKTADRSVLGCMNDMAFRCEHAIADAGGPGWRTTRSSGWNPLCGYGRRVDLAEATASLIALEAALEDGTAAGDGERQRVVAGYNEDDCRATLALRDWLEGRRAELAGRLGQELPRPVFAEKPGAAEDPVWHPVDADRFTRAYSPAGVGSIAPW